MVCCACTQGASVLLLMLEQICSYEPLKDCESADMKFLLLLLVSALALHIPFSVQL